MGKKEKEIRPGWRNFNSLGEYYFFYLLSLSINIIEIFDK